MGRSEAVTSAAIRFSAFAQAAVSNLKTEVYVSRIGASASSALIINPTGNTERQVSTCNGVFLSPASVPEVSDRPSGFSI